MAALPQGLVKSEADHVAYLAAQVIADHESAPSGFWEDALHREFKQEDGFFVNSQQPPAPGSLKRVDFIVSNLTFNQRKSRLMFVEAKRVRNDTVGLKAGLERQLADYCIEYLNSQQARDDDVHYVYAMAVVGTRGRIFACNIESGMDHMPRFGPNDGTENDGYWDAMDDGIWDTTINHIKRLPPAGFAQQ